jgi:hypothetical protein
MHANPPDPWSILLRGDDNQRLTSCVASANALIYAGSKGFVHLDPARQPVPSWSNHGAT